MKVEKIVKKTETINLTITGITLLSIEEYEACKDHIPPLKVWWWLRSPGYGSYDAAGVIGGGSVYYGGGRVNSDGVCVRPALQISNLESSHLKIGDEFEFGGKEWTVISDSLAICNKCIGERPFRKDWLAPDANSYEASDNLPPHTRDFSRE